MSIIGSFKKVGGEYEGQIVTLSLRVSGVRILPDPKSSNDRAPSHRIYVGRAEIGAGWAKTSENGNAYLSLKLDDPSLNAPIWANLCDDGEDDYILVWSRGR
jgi:uncharacterized protein (DUF736 family)